MPGPLPNQTRRRRNAPTIPTTNLPAGGRQDPPPDLPSWVELGQAGSAWWEWAWHTPQAAAWDDGAAPVVARRASLEDDLATISDVDSLDLSDALDATSAAQVNMLVKRLAGLVTGRLAILREMRELDDRLGLTPKGLAALRWRISDDQPQAEPPNLTVVPDRWRNASGA